MVWDQFDASLKLPVGEILFQDASGSVFVSAKWVVVLRRVPTGFAKDSGLDVDSNCADCLKRGTIAEVEANEPCGRSIEVMRTSHTWLGRSILVRIRQPLDQNQELMADVFHNGAEDAELALEVARSLRTGHSGVNDC